MNYQFAESMSRLGTESAFEVLAKAREMERQGKEVIHLEIGEPDFDTPKNIVDAAVKALQNGEHHYTPSQGILPLRETVAEYIGRTRAVDIKPEEVVIVPGGKPMIFLTIMTLVGPGDEVLYPNPSYPSYESAINFSGAKAVPIPLLEEKNFAFDLNELKKRLTPRTKMLIINSPSNPTGGVLSKEDLQEIAELAIRHNFLIFTDEIYSRMLYEGEHHSVISLPGMKEHTILLDGYSKTYAMTGWRLGYGVMPKPIAEKVTSMVLNTVSCTSTFVQLAGIEALKGPQTEVEKMVAEFKKRRDIIVDGLNAIPGITCKKPQGAFYVFPNIKSFNRPAREIANYLLEHAGVAGLWGTAFGAWGEGYLRFSYANSIPNIEKALSAMKRAFADLTVKA